VDYIADVWLNGKFLGSHEGMFNPFEFDVTCSLKMDGENILVVRDSSPSSTGEYQRAEFSENPLSPEMQAHQVVDLELIKGHMIDAMHRPGSMTKFRGDGNSGGIWGDVTLIAREDVFIEYVKIFTRVVKKKDWLGDQTDKYDGTGLVSVDVRINNTTCKMIETDLAMTVTPYNFKED
jgi:beta-mannosidase